MYQENNLQTEIYSCSNCGARIRYNPSIEKNSCDSCGNQYDILLDSKEITIYEYTKFVASNSKDEKTKDVFTIDCSNCGAVIQFDDNIVSGECSFCTSPLNITQKISSKKLKPDGVLPFQINHKIAVQKYHDWFRSRWFAPYDFKKNASTPDKLVGIYIPFWVFDQNTFTNYEGYKIVKRDKSTSRFFKKGSLHQEFYFLDVIATSSLPKKNVDLLEPWDWENLKPYDDKFILGFKTECYTFDPEKGYQDAQEKVKEIITKLVKSEIGGDRQEITYLNIDPSDVKFRHVLLPVWVSAFKYNNKLFRFVINGRSGEVQGERPYSKFKIALFVLWWIVAIGPLMYFWVNGPINYRITFLVIGIIQMIFLSRIMIKGFDIDVSGRKNPFAKRNLKNT